MLNVITRLPVNTKTFILLSTAVTTAVGRAVAPQQRDSISAVCVLTRVRLCLFMLCECGHACICMYECVSLPVREHMSLSVCTQWARGLCVWT